MVDERSQNIVDSFPDLVDSRMSAVDGNRQPVFVQMDRAQDIPQITGRFSRDTGL